MMVSSAKREELVGALESAGAEMEGLIEEVGETRLTEPGVTGEWSVKDLVAHVTAWEERILAWVEGLRKGTKPEPAPWPKGLSEEEVNALIYESNRDRPLAEVLDHWRNVHQNVSEAVQRMSDEELFEREVEWLGGPFAGAVPGTSYEHLQNHSAEIQAWLRGKKGGGGEVG